MSRRPRSIRWKGSISPLESTRAHEDRISLEPWHIRPLTDLGVIYVYLDGFALRVRSTGKVVSVPMLSVVGVLADAQAPCPLQDFRPPPNPR